MEKVLAILCSAVILLGFSLPAAAAETILDVTYIPITGEGFVADTFNGVDAMYNLTGDTLYCSELVIRYYKEVYGIDIVLAGGSMSVQNNANYYFEQTDTPAPGDVMYGSAEARGKDYNHWAIVKAVDDDSVVCFEQNWRWNDEAGVNRRVPLPNDNYEFYTLKAKVGTPKVINGSADVVSAWAQESVQKAADCGIAALTGYYQQPVTRAVFCSMAVNVAALHGVAAADTSADACAQAAELGLVSSADNADAPVSREEAAVILTRLLGKIGSVPEAARTALKSYSDASKISFWAADAVARVTSCGLMSGTGAAFQPKTKLTNEQAAALMVRVSEDPNPSVKSVFAEPAETPKAEPIRAAAQPAAPDPLRKLMDQLELAAPGTAF
jgi:hypothetical protein